MPLPYAAFTLTFGIAFLLSLGLTPLAVWLGQRRGLVAVPGGRRQHHGRISRIGGIPVYIAFTAAVLASQLVVINPAVSDPTLGPVWQVLRLDPKEIFRLIGLLGGGTFIFLVGLYDDWREMSPLAQWIAQIIAAAIAVAFLIVIEYVNNPLTGQQTPDFPYLITVIISLFWLGLMMNTVNWLDGLDGLAVGVTAIACVVLLVNAVFRLNPPQHSVALLPLALLGATLGFLPYNFTPARIFLGSGAYFVGFTLGALSIIGGAKMAAILLVMGLPLLDLAWQVVNRLAQGRSPAEGDRGHLHFRLLDLGLSQRQIVLGYYVFCAAFGGLALAIPSRLYKLIALGAMGLLALAGFVWLSRRKPGKVSAVRLRDVIESDLPIFFEHQLDPEATRMADFPSRPREDFMAHWRGILKSKTILARTILFNGKVAGNVVFFEQSGEKLVGYWLGREFWGKGIATRALAEFLTLIGVRPLYARVARHNRASIRVLEKCGFTLSREEGEELVLKLV